MKKIQKLFIKNRTRAIALLSVVVLLAGIAAPQVWPKIAAQTCSTIAECQNQIQSSRDAVADLKQTALGYQDAIDKLNAEIGTLQGSIDANNAEQARLQAEIEKAQAEIDRQRAILAEGVKSMYVDGTPSTLEMIAAEGSLSKYIDKAEYRTAVQRKLQTALKEIAVLQKQLSEQKARVLGLLTEQRQQQNRLVTARAEQANMLAYNAAQQAEFNRQTRANQSKLNELIEAQRRANRASYPAGSLYFIRVPGEVKNVAASVDDYPYKRYGFSMQLGPCSTTDSYPDEPDKWGYCTRQCTSYVAWAVERSGRTAPKYWGNAKNWVNRAPDSWIHRTPQAGDIAVSTAGTWGHVMYVHAVNGDSIQVSDYNRSLTGAHDSYWRKY